MSRISENVGASTTRNPKGLHGLYRDNFTYFTIMSASQGNVLAIATGFVLDGPEFEFEC
jgi:hypothetical protein